MFTSLRGKPGADGAQGIQGIQGDTGIQGIQGDTGIQGIQGEQGIQGIQGEAGSGALIHRDEVSSYDYGQANFTKNNAWQDWDLSGVVTVGATAVLFALMYNCATIDSILAFRKKGLSQNYNINTRYVSVASHLISSEVIMLLDANAFGQYKMSNVTWAQIYVVILGWWL